jgi:hypothetical protein
LETQRQIGASSIVEGSDAAGMGLRSSVIPDDVGPAQLALAILADALSDDRRAARLHERFKGCRISGIGDEWSMTEVEVI